MSRRRKVVVLGAGVAVLATVSLVLATRPGSTAGPWDGWGCPPEQIGTTISDFFAYEGGFATAEQALRAEAEFQATDGALGGDRYLEALASRSGPNRYDPDSGELYLDGEIHARFTATELEDGTWVVAHITNCGPPPPDDPAPGPTP